MEMVRKIKKKLFSIYLVHCSGLLMMSLNIKSFMNKKKTMVIGSIGSGVVCVHTRIVKARVFGRVG